MDNTAHRMDKTVYASLSFEEADRRMNSSEGLSWEERVFNFNYLMSVAFRFYGKPWPKMDKTHFEKIKRP